MTIDRRTDQSADDVLTRAGIFQGVEPSAVSALRDDLTREEYSKGDVIIREGEQGDSLYIVTSGKVKLSRKAPDGRENLLSILGPSDMFGELSIFDPGPRTSSAVCVTDVTVQSMDRQALKRWIAERPEISDQLLRVLARRLRRTNNNLADLIFTDGPGRVAKLESHLPFELTRGQRLVHEDIARDLSRPTPMNRLLQGEVGSGKTVVALLGMLQVLDVGRQSVLLAPTEVLAGQHARTISGLLDDAGVDANVALLTGSTSVRA